MTAKETKALIAKAFDDAVREDKIEDQLKRLESMPDVLERYDKVMIRIGRLSMISDWIDNHLKRSENAYPQELIQAAEFLGQEIADTKAEQ